MRRVDEGASLRIGRDPSNDLPLHDPRVSRFHCQVGWRPGAPWPYVSDLHSANGTLVDGEEVDERELHGGETLEVGPFQLHVEVRRAGDPSALVDDDDLIDLDAHELPGPSGLVPPGGLRALLWELDADRRTGTLVLDAGARQARLAYGHGRIVAAYLDEGTRRRRGVEAVRGTLEAGFAGGRYRFERSLEPGDDATILGGTRVGLPLASILIGDSTQALRRDTVPPEPTTPPDAGTTVVATDDEGAAPSP